jgi:hypothetical protein
VGICRTCSTKPSCVFSTASCSLRAARSRCAVSRAARNSAASASARARTCCSAASCAAADAAASSRRSRCEVAAVSRDSCASREAAAAASRAPTSAASLSASCSCERQIIGTARQRCVRFCAASVQGCWSDLLPVRPAWRQHTLVHGHCTKPYLQILNPGVGTRERLSDLVCHDCRGILAAP